MPAAARVARQVLTESLVLAAAGGMLGIISAAWLLQALLAVIPRGMLPSEADPQLSVPVLLFALLTTTVCGLLFGSAPAWQASQVDLERDAEAERPHLGWQWSAPAAPGARCRRARVGGHLARRRRPVDPPASGNGRRSISAFGPIAR